MRVVIARDTSLKLDGWVVSSSLSSAVSSAKGLGDTVDTLVIYDPEPVEFVQSLLTYKDHNTLPKLVYISGTPSPLILGVVRGLGGSYQSDEFFLESSVSLNTLLDTLEEEAPTHKDIVRSFLGAPVDSGPKVRVAQSAFEQYVSYWDSYESQSLDALEAVVGMLGAAGTRLQKTSEELKDLRDRLNQLQADSARNMIPKGFSSVTFFPRVNYPGGKTIYRFKSVGSMKYLTSFSLAFQNYLRFTHSEKVRLIFLEPPGDVPLSRFSHFTWVGQSTPRNHESLHESVLFTNFPRQAMLSALLEDPLYDSVIVVDRLTTNIRHLVSTGSTNTIYAVDSPQSARRLELPLRNTVCSVHQDKDLLGCIPAFQNYAPNRQQRLQQYNNSMSDLFSNIRRISHGR